MARRGHSVLGLDVAESMIRIAQQDAPANARFDVADAHPLAEQGECDVLVSLNVLAYLTDEESEAFWEGARRVVRSGGSLLLSHSNELFDLFALNAGTAAFFARHFDADVTPLLTTSEQHNPTYNVRANPLTYPSELQARGFQEVAQAFFNYHPAPPSLLGPGDSGRVVDPEAIARIEPWKQALQSSTYFSLATRTD
jgi:SAM-dependent methyltransferase